MLGQMDSIKRGEILIIAATNRLESLDPALTRPGRFDRSVEFFHPKDEGRKAILEIHTAQWKRGRESKALDEIAKQTEGYTGADLEQLCRQTFLCAIRRQFPNQGSEKVDTSEFEKFDVLMEDWNSAMNMIKPQDTGKSNISKAFSPEVSKLISGIRNEILAKLPPFIMQEELSSAGSGLASFLIWESGASETRSMLHSFIIPSLIGSTELKHTTTFRLEEGPIKISAFKALVGKARGCTQNAILYLPRIDKIGDRFSDGDTDTPRLFLEQLESLRGESVLILGSSSRPVAELPEELRPIFNGVSATSRSYKVRPLEKTEIREFFVEILEEKFPVMLDRVVDLTENSNIYDLLDLKGEMGQVCETSKDSEVKDAVATTLNSILDTFADNQLHHRTQRNNMYS